jgi:hypothetical protein
VRAHGPLDQHRLDDRHGSLRSHSRRAGRGKTGTPSSFTRSAHTPIRADATAATSTAASRREPRPSRFGLLPRTCRTLRDVLAQSHEHTMLDGERCTKPRHDTSTSVECSEHQPGRPCARSREASEHGRPAHRPAGLRSSLRECARQDRGEVRAHGPRGPSYTRRSPRLSSINGRKAEAMTATAASPTRSAHTSIRADARAATISATSRREPQPSRVGLLPSDLPGASRRPHAEPRAHGARGHARRRVTTRARPSNALSTRRGRPCARSRDATARTAEEALI